MLPRSFFFNEPATTEIYTLSLHDALPISPAFGPVRLEQAHAGFVMSPYVANQRMESQLRRLGEDRKSTRLNSSHMSVSYAVFCLKKKKYSTAAHPVLSVTA